MHSLNLLVSLTHDYYGLCERDQGNWILFMALKPETLLKITSNYDSPIILKKIVLKCIN